MLLGKSHKDLRQVAIAVRSPQFKGLLTSLLAGWKIDVAEDVGAGGIYFIERGLPEPATAARVIWLTPLPLHDGEYLLIPISPTKLHLLLEEHFFPTPRRHIRIVMDSEADLQVDGRWHESRLVSISDRGARMTCPFELAKGAGLTVEMKLDGRTVRCPADVLYCLPSGDSIGRSHSQVGVLFRPHDTTLYGQLQQMIEKLSIATACDKAGVAFNDPCVRWFDIDENSLRKTR